MLLYWLVYRHNNSISVVIEPGASLIHARMRAALGNLDEGEFTEGHELPGKWKVASRWLGDGYRRPRQSGCWRSSSEGRARATKSSLEQRSI